MNKVGLYAGVLSGSGVPPAFPPLAGAAILDDNARLVRTTLFGRPGTAMPAQCAMDAADVAAILDYVRGAWGAPPRPPISAQQVRTVAADPANPCKR